MSCGDAELIRGTLDRYIDAYRAHQAEGCAAEYAPDALILSPWEPPVRGRSAIIAAHEAWFLEGEQNKQMTIEDLRISDRLAFCLIAFEAEVPDEQGGISHVFGASLNILQREGDGASWQIMYTSLQALEAPIRESKK